ncbi:hypothetical protein [Cystobacter fuscus]|uniref:hypothetical protein n=1 Tax=Cystobacter fuscus TaxID=43 RepID=UPI0037C08A85
MTKSNVPVVMLLRAGILMSASAVTGCTLTDQENGDTETCQVQLCGDVTPCYLQLCGIVPNGSNNADASTLNRLISQTYVAISWPANIAAGRGVALAPTDPSALATYIDQPRVWETWKQDWEAQGDIAALTDWDSYEYRAGRPPCDEVHLRNGQVIPVTEANWTELRKAHGMVLDKINLVEANNDGLAVLSGPLIEDNGTYQRFATFFNQPLYECWRTGTGPGCSKEGRLHVPAADGSTPGAIMVKSAWRELIQADIDAQTFLSRNLLVLDPGQGGKRECHERTMGLTALHVVYKDADLPAKHQWLWGSLEYQANDLPKCLSSEGGVGYQNKAPPVTCEPLPPGKPTDACRIKDIPDGFYSQMNTASALGSLPGALKSYQMVAAQWGMQTGDTVQASPPEAANARFETYSQKSSCLGCHEKTSASDAIWSLSKEIKELNGNPCAYQQ